MPTSLSYAHVAVIERSRAGIDRLFSYSNTVGARTGDVVRIPFGKRTVEGVVLGTSPQAPNPVIRRYRSILAITQKKALTKEQCELAAYLAREYRAPWGSFLPSFLNWNAWETSLTPNVSHHQSSPIKTLSPKERTLAGKLSKNTRTVFINKNESERIRFIGHALSQSLVDNECALILFPDITSLERASHVLCKFSEKNDILRIYGSLSPKIKRGIGQYFYTKHRPCIILGTRSALFLPFQQLRFVITEMYHRQAHKQDFAQPRYDGRRLALALAQFHQSRMINCDGFLTTTLLALIQDKGWKSIISPSEKRKSSLSIIDKYKDRSFSKNRIGATPDPISPTLMEALRQAKQRSQLSLIVCSRRGMNAVSFCTACKQPLLCPKCRHALVLQESGSYICIQCSYTGDIFTSCPHCRGMSFSHKSPGTQAIVSQLRKHIPDAVVVRTDADSEYYVAKRLRKFSQKQDIDIVVGTPAILSRWPLRQPGCTAIADTESFWRWPQYDAHEKAYEIFSRTTNLIDPKLSRAYTYIQTTHPDHPIFQALLSLPQEKELLTNWLEERKALSYPPHARLITITATHIQENQSQRQIQNARDTVLFQLPKDIRPSPIFTPMKRTNEKFSRRFVLKIPQFWHDPLPNTVIHALSRISPACHIDIDPTEIA